MARTDTLPHFLTDVADAIRTKKGSQETIQASDFDTEIENLPSGGSDVILPTTETKVGLWVDNKPLYNKGIEYTYDLTNSGDADILIDYNVDNVEEIFFGANSFIEPSEGDIMSYPLNYCEAVSGVVKLIKSYPRTNGKARVLINQGLIATGTIKITLDLLYTKTTDSPVN